MADTTFVNGTLITPEWLNIINDSIYGNSGNELSSRKGYVSVKDAQFGAVGDGSTDDTAAIQAALDTGGTVFLPPGNYRTTATLVMDVIGTRFIGAGRNTATILADFRGGAVIEINQARCSITDMAVSTLAGSARRLASPLGVTPPSVNVDGLSNDRGIFLNEVGFLTYTQLARVEIVYQPGDGLNMSGVGTCTRIEQVNVVSCGGHGMYFDDGDRDGTAKTRCGIVDIVSCIVQQCWGHGIALGTDSATTCYRFSIVNCDIFSNCLGDGGTDQPSFYSSAKAEIAARCENLLIEQGAVGFSDYGILLGNTNCAEILNTRYVTCGIYGLLINPNCTRIKNVNPYFSSAPATAGFRVQTGCTDIRIEGIVTSELGTIIDAESEVACYIGNKLVYTVPGTNTLWYNDEIKSATISSGVCNINSGIVQMIGEGDVTDTVNQLRITSGVAIPDGYKFIICNFNAYNLNLQDLTVGGSANIQVQGTTAVLEPGESLSFVVRSNVCYAIGREIP